MKPSVSATPVLTPLILLFNPNPFLPNIRSEERFKKLMERAKKEWEESEV